MKNKALFLIRHAKRSFYGTFLSRIFGMFRDISLAFFFGSSPEIAMFMLSYRFANLFRRFIGEGSMQAGFIPHFERIRQESEKQSATFFRDLFFSLLVSVFILVGLLEIGLILFQKTQPVGSFIYDSLTLTMLMLPSLIFISIYALNSALLQCLKLYFLPAFAPVLFNVVWIVSVFLLRAVQVKTAVIVLSSAVVVAFTAQWVLTQIPSTLFFIRHLSLKQWFQAKLFPKEVRQLYKPLSFSMIGVGAVQVNSALDTIFARMIDPSGPAYLWYSIRLQMLPLSLFSIALAGALLPSLSRALNRKDYVTHLQIALRLAFALMSTFTLGIFVLGASGLNLIYGRGDFSLLATKESIYCLWGYGIGLIPATFVLLLANGFYAKKNYKMPMISSVLSVIINIVLNSLFVFVLRLNTASIALATSISAFCNCLCLIGSFPEKCFETTVYRSFVKSLICSFCGAGIVVGLGYFLLKDPTMDLIRKEPEILFSREFIAQTKQFFVQATIYFSLIGIMAKVIRHRDLLNLTKKISHLSNKS